jgi:uncharacterized protein GlcG (DUF336 family)
LSEPLAARQQTEARLPVEQIDTFAAIAQSGSEFFCLRAPNRDRVMMFAGGLLLERGAEVVGGIGASDGEATQDENLPEAGTAVS